MGTIAAQNTRSEISTATSLVFGGGDSRLSLLEESSLSIKNAVRMKFFLTKNAFGLK